MDKWQALMHYQKSWWGGVKSTIDSENFFLAPTGKTNPKEELNATITLFNTADKKRCLFPARYLFLKQQGLIKNNFPDCPDYTQFKKDLRATGLTLLYTDAYMNNPSSLFGHTLLRTDIDTSEKTQLMAHGVNYGAFVPPDENGLFFALWGLTGGYWGGFTVKPYYQIINMYNNLENRDIWEFSLDLSPAELDFFIAHLWELGHTQTRYFFFTENCSYLLMEVLDAVRPEMRLSQQFSGHVIPLDTIKAIQGLVKNTTYRPSRQKRISNGYAQLSPAEKEALFPFIKKQDLNLAHLSSSQKANVLAVAYEYIQYQWEARKIDLKTYRTASFSILKQRAELTTAETLTAPAVPASPFKAHHSARLQVSAGQAHQTMFQEVQIRPAYHSLTESDTGLLKGASIHFLNTAVRYYNQQHKTVLQQVNVVGITSLSPYSLLFQPTSFRVNLDINRVFNPATKQQGYTSSLEGGAGITIAPSPFVWLYALGIGRVEYGGFMNKPIALGIGASVGVLLDYGRLKIQVQGDTLIPTDKSILTAQIAIKTQYNLSKNVGWFTEYQLEKRFNHHINCIQTGFRFYF